MVDPRSGWPVREVLQAAVVAATAAEAEALSTALVVLGQSEGLALVESIPGAEALCTRWGAEPAATSGWKRATGFEAQPSSPPANAAAPTPTAQRGRASPLPTR